jgi:hypothetical protein
VYWVVNISIVIAVGSFLVSIAAFLRAGRNYAEEQRDKLLAQISDLAIEAWKRDSELVALQHVHAGVAPQIQEACRDVIATAKLLRDTLRTQIGEFDSRFTAVATARGFGMRALFTKERIDIYRHLPLLAAQNQEIGEHIRKGTERLTLSGQLNETA